jgi:hypothetical protein
MTEFNDTPAPVSEVPGGDADPGAPAADAAAPADGITNAPSFDAAAFSGQWKDYVSTLSDESHKDLASRFTSPQDLIDVAVKQRKEMSTRIKLPGKDATPEDIATFHKQIGVPSKPEEYEVKVPEGYELPETTAAILDQFKAKALERGVRKSEFGALAETYLEMEKASVEAELAEIAEGQKAGKAEIAKIYGKDADMHMNAARDLLHKLEIPGMEDFLGTTVLWGSQKVPLGDHPVWAQTLAKLGLRGGEAQPGGLNLVVTRDDKVRAKERIKEIYAQHPAGSDSYKSPAVQRELQSLFEKIGDE